MTVGVDKIVTEINSRLTTCGSDPQTLLQLTASAAALENSYLVVADETKLPTASENKGRFAYIESLCDYRYSNGTEWSRQFESAPLISDTLYTWGCNSNYAQLGDGTAINRSSPVSVIGDIFNWCDVSVSLFNGGAVRQDGTIWMWGRGNNGQLGNGLEAASRSPVSIAGGFNDWCKLSGAPGYSFAFAAIRNTGSIWTWGINGFGALGVNSTVRYSSPVSVIGGFEWCAVSVGAYYSMNAIRSDGTLWGWGRNSYGTIGNNSTIARSSPVSVVGGFTDWCQISASGKHVAGLRSNGTIWTWGANNVGQLGNNALTPRSSPVSVVGGFTDWCQVSAGWYHTAAIRTNGTLWSWGCNGQGRLGDDTVLSKRSPISVVGGFTNWCQVSAGYVSTGAVRTDGSAWVWGTDRLGDGTTLARSSPVSVAGGISTWCKICVGRGISAAIEKDGILRGFNTP